MKGLYIPNDDVFDVLKNGTYTGPSIPFDLFMSNRLGYKRKRKILDDLMNSNAGIAEIRDLPKHEFIKEHEFSI